MCGLARSLELQEAFRIGQEVLDRKIKQAEELYLEDDFLRDMTNIGSGRQEEYNGEIYKPN